MNSNIPELESWLQEGTLQTFEPDQVLIRTSHESGNFGYLDSGIVKSMAKMKVSGNAQPTIVDIFGPGSWIGIESFGAGGNLVLYRAITEGSVFIFDKSQIPLLPPPLLLTICAQIADFSMTQMCLNLLRNAQISVRLCYRLAMLKEFLDESELVLTQRDLAGMIGTQQSRISKILAQLVKIGLLEKGYRSYRILGDNDAFAQVALSFTKSPSDSEVDVT